MLSLCTYINFLIHVRNNFFFIINVNKKNNFDSLSQDDVNALIEEKIQKATNNKSAHLIDYFDFFAGTSTGGILLSILLCPADENATKPKYTAKQAMDIYLEHGTAIFSAKPWRRFLGKFGLVSELYDATVLEKILLDYFGDKKLSELLKPCIIRSLSSPSSSLVI